MMFNCNHLPERAILCRSLTNMSQWTNCLTLTHLLTNEQQTANRPSIKIPRAGCHVVLKSIEVHSVDCCRVPFDNRKVLSSVRLKAPINS